MVIKKGRYGPFWACSRYPECKTIVPLKEKPKPKPTGEKCPLCGADLVERMGRFGKPFIGCSAYPKCRYIKKEPKASKKDEKKEEEITVSASAPAAHPEPVMQNVPDERPGAQPDQEELQRMAEQANADRPLDEPDFGEGE